MKTAVEWLEDHLELVSSGHVKIGDLIKQAKQMEKEQKYSIDFIKWYSGMKQEQIEKAHTRWINETFKNGSNETEP